MPIRPRSGRSRVVRPEKNVLQFGGAGMFEAEYLATLWVDPRHHMLDGAILPSRIHRLKDQQDRIAVGCVEKLLQCAQLRNVAVPEVFDSAPSIYIRARRSSATSEDRPRHLP